MNDYLLLALYMTITYFIILGFIWWPHMGYTQAEVYDKWWG